MKIKKLNDLARIPIRATEGSAGYDVFATDEYELQPNERRLFKLGFAISIPNGLYGRIAPRSGLALKKGIDVLAGVIDNDYRNEVGVILINFGNESVKISIGDKIAQLIFENYSTVTFEESDVLEDTNRTGGYGSTDSTPPFVPIPTCIIGLFNAQNNTQTATIKYEDVVRNIESKL